MTLEELSIYGGIILCVSLSVLCLTFVALCVKNFTRLRLALASLLTSWLAYRLYWVYFWQYVNDDWRLNLFVPLWVFVMAVMAIWTTYELFRKEKNA